MGADKTVRGCTRGLAILRTLNQLDYASVLQLSRATGLPRPTIYRLLETLVDAGYVSEVNGGDRYCLTSSVRWLSSGFNHKSLATEVARPLVDEFGRSTGWSAYVHVLDGDAMVTRQIVPSPRLFNEARFGSRLSLLYTSPGRYFLANLPAEKRQSLIAKLRSNERPSRELANQVPGESLLQAIRYRGCGIRDDGFVPRTCSVALPIMWQNEPLAFVTLVFIRSVVPIEKAIRTFVPPMRELVQRIETRFRNALGSHIDEQGTN